LKNIKHQNRKAMKISAIIWFALSGAAMIISLFKWELTYCLMSIVFYFIGKVAWQEYRELKDRDELYMKFRKSNKTKI